MSQSRSLPRLAAALVAAVAAVGCGAQGPDLVAVTGTVTQDGQPVVHAAVLFSPVPGNDPLLAGEGITDSDGRYRLVSDERNGAVPGKYHVVIHRAAGELPPETAASADSAPAVDPYMASLVAGVSHPVSKKKKGGPVVIAGEYSFDIEVAGKGGALDFDIPEDKPKTADASK